MGQVQTSVKFRHFALWSNIVADSLWTYHLNLNLVRYLILRPSSQQCRWIFAYCLACVACLPLACPFSLSPTTSKRLQRRLLTALYQNLIKKNVENYWVGMFCKNEVDTLRVFNKMDVSQSDRKLHRISTKYGRIFLYTFCHMLITI